jgi:hypothetical protein
MDEDAVTFGFLVLSVALFITGIVWQGLYSILFSMIMSGNIFLEAMGVAGFLLSFIGALILLYCLMVAIFYVIIFGAIFGVPAYLIYRALGLEYTIILAIAIGLIATIYLIETHTVEIEHYTVTLNLHRRYIIKR